MMRQHHRVECVIVESDRAPGEMSIRPETATFRRRLKDAGFRVGDRVAIVVSRTK